MEVTPFVISFESLLEAKSNLVKYDKYDKSYDKYFSLSFLINSHHFMISVRSDKMKI